MNSLTQCIWGLKKPELLSLQPPEHPSPSSPHSRGCGQWPSSVSPASAQPRGPKRGIPLLGRWTPGPAITGRMEPRAWPDPWTLLIPKSSLQDQSDTLQTPESSQLATPTHSATPHQAHLLLITPTNTALNNPRLRQAGIWDPLLRCLHLSKHLPE